MVDTTPPVFAGVPVDVTVQCYAIPVAPAVTAADNCDTSVDVLFREASTVAGGCGIILRTWNAADDCGNTVSVTQKITVVDNTPPIIACPEDVTLTLTGGSSTIIWPYVNPTATDNCTAADQITITGIRSNGKPLSDPWPEGVTTITWTAADGCQNSSSCEQKVTVKPGCLTLDAWVYLEGAMIASDGTGTYLNGMRTDLNRLRVLPGQSYADPFFGVVNYTPKGQPYQGAPWSYAGTEGDGYDSVGDPANGDAGYPSTVVDWVLVSLRSGTATETETSCKKAALLHSDGRIEFAGTGFNCCNIDINGSYYVVIEHRNHLVIMSSTAIQVINGKLTCDFRTMQSYYDPLFPDLYAGQKAIPGGRYVMYAGNGNQESTGDSDTDISLEDQGWWEKHNGTAGQYRSGDYNLSGDANMNDRTLWERNNGKFTMVPR